MKNMDVIKQCFSNFGLPKNRNKDFKTYISSNIAKTDKRKLMEIEDETKFIELFLVDIKFRYVHNLRK